MAANFRLNWKTVASIMEATVLWGLAHRRWAPLHVIGIDEVSHWEGQQSLTLVYDLARRRVVCCDTWRPYLAGLRTAVPRATVVFDRFHLTRYAMEVVGTVRRQLWRQLAEAEKPDFKWTRFPWLKNPLNLRREARTRLSGLLRLNAPGVKGYLLKKDLGRFWV